MGRGWGSGDECAAGWRLEGHERQEVHETGEALGTRHYRHEARGTRYVRGPRPELATWSRQSGHTCGLSGRRGAKRIRQGQAMAKRHRGERAGGWEGDRGGGWWAQGLCQRGEKRRLALSVASRCFCRARGDTARSASGITRWMAGRRGVGRRCVGRRGARRGGPGGGRDATAHGLASSRR